MTSYRIEVKIEILDHQYVKIKKNSDSSKYRIC